MAGLGMRGSLRPLPTRTMLGLCDQKEPLRAGHWEKSMQEPRDRLCDSPELPPGLGNAHGPPEHISNQNILGVQNK